MQQWHEIYITITFYMDDTSTLYTAEYLKKSIPSATLDELIIIRRIIREQKLHFTRAEHSDLLFEVNRRLIEISRAICSKK